jgi:hypothetical protein
MEIGKARDPVELHGMEVNSHEILKSFFTQKLRRY